MIELNRKNFGKRNILIDIFENKKKLLYKDSIKAKTFLDCIERHSTKEKSEINNISSSNIHFTNHIEIETLNAIIEEFWTHYKTKNQYSTKESYLDIIWGTTMKELKCFIKADITHYEYAKNGYKLYGYNDCGKGFVYNWIFIEEEENLDFYKQYYSAVIKTLNDFIINNKEIQVEKKPNNTAKGVWNLGQRYELLKDLKITDIYTKNTQFNANERATILSQILGCSHDNARHLINGTYGKGLNNSEQETQRIKLIEKHNNKH